MKKHAYCDAFYAENGQKQPSPRLEDLISLLSKSPFSAFGNRPRNGDRAENLDDMSSPLSRDTPNAFEQDALTDGETVSRFGENRGFSCPESCKIVENREKSQKYKSENCKNHSDLQKSEIDDCEKTAKSVKTENIRNGKPQKNGGAKDYFSPPPYYGFPENGEY